MGYKTYHSLSIMNVTPEVQRNIISELREACSEAECAIDDDGYTLDDVKWYEHEEDLKKFSKKYPHAVFDLSGEGEESEDKWHTYFKNGKLQRCPAIISYDEYDEQKLE